MHWLQVIVAVLCLCPLRAASGTEERRIDGSLIVASAHYRIESDCERASVEQMSEALEVYFTFLSGHFSGHLPPIAGPMTVRFLRDRAGFLAYGKRYCANFNAGWSGYYFYGAKAEECELVAFDLGANRSILFHEGFHQFMHRAFPGIRAWPQWFNEGIADYVARGRPFNGTFIIPATIDANDRNLVRDAIANQTYLPLDGLFALGIKQWNGDDMALHYAEGYLLAYYLMNARDAKQRGLIPAFLAALSERQDYPTAFAATIGGAEQKQLERDFRAFVSGGN